MKQRSKKIDSSSKVNIGGGSLPVITPAGAEWEDGEEYRCDECGTVS